MNHKTLFLVITLAALVALVILPPVYGGDAARTGTAGGTQVLVPVGARNMAMAGSNVATVYGLEAMYWNPAGLSSMEGVGSGVFSTMKIFNDVNVNYVAVATRLGSLGHFGVDLKSISFGDIPVTTVEDIEGASGATFSPTFLTVGLTYSKRLTDVIQVGLVGKLISESAPRASASAFAFDIGIQYHNLGGFNGVSMGLAVKNIGSDIHYSGSAFLQTFEGGTTFREIPTASHKLPATVEIGLGYKRNLNEENSLYFSGDFLNNNFGNDDYKFGLEYQYSDLIALRGGYLFTQNVDAEDQLYDFTLGVGLHYQFGKTDMAFDYAYRNIKNSYFDGSNMFSLAIGF
jgi:hypothetical protein